MDVTYGLPASSLVAAAGALAPAPLSDVRAGVPAFPLQATSARAIAKAETNMVIFLRGDFIKPPPCRYAAVNRYEKGASIIKPHLGTRSL